jgi:acyl-CoA thioesterase FadM
MVTNFTRTEIFGYVRNSETIEARVWIDKVFGPDNSSLLLNFQWRKLTADGAAKEVAFSQQQVSWIKTVGHGVVEPIPCPEFFMDFVIKNNFLPRTDSAGPGDGLTGAPAISAEGLGKTLYEGDVMGEGDLLKESLFDTVMEHSNLAQNVYYSNYFEWQGHLRDRYLFEISPEQYRRMGVQGQLACVDCKIHHLREAMPFDRIAVRMKLQRLYERGVSLFFEYFRVDPGETRQKLAYGYHTLAWVRVDGSDRYVPQSLPEVYVEHMLRRDPKDK